MSIQNCNVTRHRYASDDTRHSKRCGLLFQVRIWFFVGTFLPFLASCNTAQQTLNKIDKTTKSMPLFGINAIVDMTPLAKIACLEQRPDNAYVAELLRQKGWATRPKIDPTCRVVIMYNHDQPNEIMGPIYSLLYTTPNSVNEFYLSTEKCKFDVLRDARFRAVYLLAFAVETEQSSFENCALRIALAVGGRPGAIVIKDRVIAKEGSGLVERRLREALELSGSDR